MRKLVFILFFLPTLALAEAGSGRFACDEAEGTKADIRLSFTPYRELDEGYLGSIYLSIKEDRVETYRRFNNQTLDTSGEDLFLPFPDGSLKLIHKSDNYYQGQLFYLGSQRNYKILMDCYFSY
jgi:hypothetical protein